MFLWSSRHNFDYMNRQSDKIEIISFWILIGRPSYNNFDYMDRQSDIGIQITSFWLLLIKTEKIR